MKVIVPVDFSDISVNTAEFAASMIQGKYGASLVLYHMFAKDDEETLVMKNLEWLQESFQHKYHVKISCKAEQDSHFINCLTRLARFEDADLVVMSITDRRKIVEESYSLQMIEQNICPVLVVPPSFTYKDVRNIAIACDFKKVEQLIPLVPVKKVLGLFGAKLHIVNVSSEAAHNRSDNYLAQMTALREMFAESNPVFHFLYTEGFHESLRKFVLENKIDLVLTFPRKHSFFNYLLKGTNTRKLVYDAEVPVLAAHE